MLLDEQARRFFDRWHALQPGSRNIAAMRGFFDGWRSLAPAAPPSAPALKHERFNEFATAFQAAYRNYRRSGVAANAWRTAGIGKDEMRNSAVLRWLLDGFGDHGQGPAILAALLRQLQLDNLAKLAIRYPYWTRVESCPFGERESRIDIEIENPHFIIFIEVKVGAGESGDQLERYRQLATRKAGNTAREWAVIFLTPTGRAPKTEAQHGHITAISWKSVAAVVEQHIRDTALDTSVAGLLLHQFAEHMRTLR
jgi:hypothetical protein